MFFVKPLVASNVERCKYEDEECMVNSWNKYIKLVDTVGELFQITMKTFVFD